jgi:hypothetical protein
MKAKISGITLLVVAGVGPLVSVSAAPVPANKDVTAAQTQSLLMKVHGYHSYCLWGPRAFHRHVGPRIELCSGQGPFYHIVNKSTGMVATVADHSTQSGAQVVLWPAYGDPSQMFFLTDLHMEKSAGEGAPPNPDDQGFSTLKASHSGLCLSITPTKPAAKSGTPVIQHHDCGIPETIWRVRAVNMTDEECPNRNQCFGGQRLILQSYMALSRSPTTEHLCLDAANVNFPTPPQQGTMLVAVGCIPKFTAPNYVNQEWELVDVRDFYGTPVHHPGDP